MIQSGSGRSLQREKRGYHEEWADQHMRKFGAFYERDTMRPVGELKPVGFNPPWLPPMRYIQWEREGSFRFAWNYDAIADEWSGHVASYYEDATKYALDHNLPVPDVGGPVDRRIRSQLGKPPLSPAIPLACKLGMPWILGVPGAKPDEALKACLSQSVGANGREALEAIQKLIAERHEASGEEAVPTIALDFDADKIVKARSIHDIVETELGAAPEISWNDYQVAMRKKGVPFTDIINGWRLYKQEQAAVGV